MGLILFWHGVTAAEAPVSPSPVTFTITSQAEVVNVGGGVTIETLSDSVNTDSLEGQTNTTG